MKYVKVWYMGGPDLDKVLTDKFQHLYPQIHTKMSWLNDHNGRLSYILLCDQYSRNIFRKTANAFKYDHLALAACKSIIKNG